MDEKLSGALKFSSDGFNKTQFFTQERTIFETKLQKQRQNLRQCEAYYQFKSQGKTPDELQ